MRILFFAQLRDITGQAEWHLNAGEVDAERLWASLLKTYPALAPYRTSTRLARNSEFASPMTTFREGDEVALIPPVSGG